MEEMGKHEFGKKVLTHTGTSHSREDTVDHEVGHHHNALGEHEKKALEGKKHNRI